MYRVVKGKKGCFADILGTIESEYGNNKDVHFLVRRGNKAAINSIGVFDFSEDEEVYVCYIGREKYLIPNSCLIKVN